MGLGVFHEDCWGVVLEDLAVRQDQDSVTLDNRVESMSNRDDRAFSKLLLDERLNFLLSDDVNIGSRFVKDHNLVLPEDRPANANQLPLTSAEVSASL